MKIRSMRTRITLAFVFILAPFLFVSSHVVVYWHRAVRAEEGRRAANALIDKSVVLFRHHHAWEQGLTAFFSTQEIQDLRIGALVADLDGQVVWRSPSDVPDWPRPTPDPAIKARTGEHVLYVAIARRPGLETNELHALLTLSFATVAMVAVGAWLVVGRTLSPIRSLARQAGTASAEDPGTRLLSPSKDAEMEELVTTLNGFLNRMEDASEEKGRFYGAASHELRTPLQALLGHLEVTLGQPRSAGEYQATVQEAHVQAQRLVSLVEGVLLLHQLQGPAMADRESVCLSGVVEQNLSILAPLLEARSLRRDVRLQPGMMAPSIPTHGSILIRNLLENAAKYGREGGVLSIVLDQVDGHPRLRIENDVAEGLDIPVDRLFEPFYRQDASRSAKSGGNGLGLAICRAVAKANGWEVALRAEGSRIVAQVDFLS